MRKNFFRTENFSGRGAENHSAHIRTPDMRSQKYAGGVDGCTKRWEIVPGIFGSIFWRSRKELEYEIVDFLEAAWEMGTEPW